MSLYLILYILIFTSLLFIRLEIYRKFFKKNYWKYLFTSIITFVIWILFYFLSFTTTYDKEVLLYLSRILYFLSLFAIYSMLFFILFLNVKNNVKYLQKANLLFIISFFMLFITTLFTPVFIWQMIYDSINKIYYEDFWKLFIIYKVLYLLSPFLIISLSFFKIKTLSLINKLRFKYISIGFSIFISLYIFFLALLPILWIWILQKEQILFFIPFVLSFFYVSHRYSFVNISLLVWKILLYITSWIFSILMTSLSLNTLFYFSNKYNWWYTLLFWKQSNIITYSDIVIYMIIWFTFFNIFYFYLAKTIFLNTDKFIFIKNINKIKKKIIFSSDFNSLNNFLNTEFANRINTKYVNIKLNKYYNLEWLEKYFIKNKSYNLFINDIVFIEENKHKFDSNKILEEISGKSYLVFPLFNNNKFIGIFEIGTKKFKDIYSSDEIALFYDFIDAIILQLKHIDIYSKIQDLNINLDKKVDEKTMEYNSLLNKQTDFISLISHEIRSPLWSCIFQSDSIIDDIKWWNLDKDYLIKELEILNTQLLSVWDLTKTLFSIKKFDLNKIELFKSKIDIHIFLSEKLNKYKRENKLIDFIIDVDSEISFIFIDKIQFWQVIDNLIVNAIKFANKENPQIYIKIYTENDNLIFEIEDNGKWFDWIYSDGIFDKYVTWNLTNVWIGMWMYLCKKIVELHGWSIKAWDGQYLNWAHFQIIMPK